MSTGEIRAIEADTAAGLPLAIYPDIEYDTFTVKLPEKYRLLFYTDGLQEAFPEHKPTKTGEFGVDGITNTLQCRQAGCADEALQALFDDSEAYTEGSGRQTTHRSCCLSETETRRSVGRSPSYSPVWMLTRSRRFF